MITIPIWVFVLMCVGCVPPIIAILSFIYFMVSGAIKDIVDERNMR